MLENIEKKIKKYYNYLRERKSRYNTCINVQDMNNKIINTFRHGDPKTKTVLGIMISGLAVGLILLIVSLLLGFPTVTFISIVLLILDIAYIAGTDFEKEALEREAKEKYKREKRKKEEKKKARDDDDEPGALEWIDGDKKERKKSFGEDSEDEDDDEEDEPSKGKKGATPDVRYTESALKKVMVQYKVRQEHVPILIDTCTKEEIYETAGILWKDKTYAYILVLEDEPRVIKFSLYNYNELHIKQGVISHPAEEYDTFKNESFLAKMYAPLLPNYSAQEDPKSRRNIYRKNLYSIGPDIWCTSNSVRNITKVLSLNAVLTDSRINGTNYGKYFKDVYMSRLMFRDSIFSASEYKEQVLETLTEMASNDDDDEFLENITQLRMNGLIPQEYVDYANQKRKYLKDAAKNPKRRR